MNLRNESIGTIQHFSWQENGLSGLAGNKQFSIKFYTSKICRIQASKHEAFDENPFSVVLPPQKVSIDAKETDQSLTLKTADIQLEIKRSPLRLCFKNNHGQILNEDDPAFGISWLGHEVTNYKTLSPNEVFLGLGEKGGGLNRRGSSFVNWNSDAFAFGNDTDPLYLSAPFYIGIREGQPYGIFFDNTHKTHFNFGASNNNRFSYFGAEAGDLNYYFIQGDTVLEVIQEYARLTGTSQLPPKWSLGFQQCRYSYYPDHEVYTVADTFRKKRIPADVIYLDIHYMEDYKAFTFDKNRFPDPKRLIEKLEAQGFKVVVILDPGIATQPGYGTYDRGVEKDIFVKYPDGSRFEASVWPGNSHFTDFTAKEGRDWWADELKFYTDKGLEGFWNDMNEPACWGQDIPNLIEFDYEGQTASHKKARNIYGFQMVRATFEGAKKQLNNKRPFTLTRAGFAGVQRYSAVWTGDNVAGDEDMLLGVRLVNSLGMTGIPVSGYDVGGFVGESAPALFARWLAVATFAPFFRVHSMVNVRDSEPWAYGEEVEEISRNYINLRYQLMPYLYSLFFEAHHKGNPINRSLAVDYYNDQNIYQGNAQNEFTLGQWLLVCPTTTTQEYSKIYLPQGKWYNFFTDELHEGGCHILVETQMEDLPVFAKEGAIIPLQNVVQTTQEKTDGILKLHLYFGEVETHQTYYEDDGSTYNFEQGQYCKREIYFNGKMGTLQVAKQEGSYTSEFHSLKIHLHGFEANSFEINGESVTFHVEDLQLLAPITEFDPLPQRPKRDYWSKGVKTLEIPFTQEEINLNWK
ncbi:glycoside hydrolase family 31 protein [Roseivirga sp. UBA838]|uniref:glycoside hydrolase family 31 protein n=1 Tax=Roseivirga sp. UBA838 TaxID=1947393 RepID=UPI0025801E67|nr:glycoside hydrolase family 31 protein [Roseivirga sp. UBA838]|tara:strand:- start:5823 stop:8228 length:2406 start_codon:yes stop_codon:yes gene_type:complete